jgi:hypothetical protein
MYHHVDFFSLKAQKCAKKHICKAQENLQNSKAYTFYIHQGFKSVEMINTILKHPHLQDKDDRPACQCCYEDQLG